MIYVLRQKGINFKTNKLEDLLKIGYTEDSNYNNRMAAYKLHNPFTYILYTIKEADDKIETALHRYFRKYRYDNYGKEWFYYNQKIIDFFKEYKTKELLEKKLQHILSYTSKIDDVQLYKNIKLIVNRWLCLISNDIDSLKESSRKIKSYILDCKNNINNKIFVKEDIVRYLKTKYNISRDIEIDLLDYISGNIKNSETVNNFLTEFTNKYIFREKMGMLCTYPLTDNERGIVLDQIPLTYKKYYEILGPSRLYALGYNITKIEKEYQATLFNKDNLKDKIYSNYQEGNKYSRNSIKEDLQKLYDSLNYTKKAKASDLEEYFEVKDCTVLNKETGKYDRGFELIKKKE